jgi:hypothetical protein
MGQLHDYVRANCAPANSNPRDDMFTDLVNMEIVEETAPAG